MKNHIQTLSKVAKTAWSLVKNLGLSLSQAMKNAWEIVKKHTGATVATLEDLKADLKRGAIRLKFQKLDGTVTERTVTTDFSLIPHEHHPKNNTPKSNTNILVFYDLFADTAKQWRTCHIENILYWYSL